MWGKGERGARQSEGKRWNPLKAKGLRDGTREKPNEKGEGNFQTLIAGPVTRTKMAKAWGRSNPRYFEHEKKGGRIRLSGVEWDSECVGVEEGNHNCKLTYVMTKREGRRKERARGQHRFYSR